MKRFRNLLPITPSNTATRFRYRGTVVNMSGWFRFERFEERTRRSAHETGIKDTTRILPDVLRDSRCTQGDEILILAPESERP